jgi:hypothetical protein
VSKLFWSALTCQRFGSSPPIAIIVEVKAFRKKRVRPRKTKALKRGPRLGCLSGQRTPKEGQSNDQGK